MRITIEAIPHNQQRYPTCGDWQFKEDFRGDTSLHIKVSKLRTPHAEFLVAVHELIEAYLASAASISERDVDEFDMNYEDNRLEGDTSEPGDDIHCPVYHQHQIATGIERLLAAELGVDWLTYEREIDEL